MSKLKAALAWAARGFPVFPLLPNEKEPVYEATWFDVATTDPARIKEMWSDPVLGTELDYNIGMDCTDRVVIDVDVKKGKDGYNEYVQLGGTFDTLVVRTPSGGYHCYFEGPDSSNSPITNSIDVRSHHGYVVAPGSVINGLAYEIVNDVEPQWLPAELDRLVKPPDVRKESNGHFDLDSSASVQAGINYLQSAPPAIEGQRGDETTFIVAARLVREMGLSVDTAFNLMAEYYNPKCQPPWQLDELHQKVENASSYGTADLGRLEASVLYATVAVEPPPVQSFLAEGLAFGNARPPLAIRPRPWLMDRMLMTGKVSMIGAAGSAGKSSMSLALAAHVVLGLPLAGYTVHKACKVIVYNGEDDTEEQSRRLLAVCMQYGFDYDEIRTRVMLLSKKEVNMRLVSSAGRGSPIRHEAVIGGLKQIAMDEDVGLIILDPLVSVHFCNESDPSEMSSVMEVLEEIAEETNTAVLALHHTTKTGSARQEERVGNMDIFRGSSGIVYACRAAFTLMDASAEDAAEFGLQDNERHLWVRMDDAKVNLTLKSPEPTMWFKKLGVKIISGDIIGVLKQEEMKRNVANLRMMVAETIITAMETIGQGSIPVVQASAILQDKISVFAVLKENDIKKRLESYFTTPFVVRERTLRFVREAQKNSSDKITLVLT